MEIQLSILILSYNRKDLLEQRLKELEPITGGNDGVEVIAIDNGSTDDTWNYLLEILRRQTTPNNFRFVKIEENISFAHGFNSGAQHAFGENYVFLSNDVQVYGDFIDPVMKVLNNEPDSIVCHQLINWPAGWNQFGAITIPYPAGYFIACSAKTWAQLEGFDERFYPTDYEDVDIGMKVMESGKFKLIELPSLPLHHGVAGTVPYGPSRMLNTYEQRERFAKKWGLPNEPERP